MNQLRNAGPIRPAPRLQRHAQAVSAEIQSWPGMIAVTHWHRDNPSAVDGAEFHVESGGELGHIHLNGEIHLALTRALRDQLVAAKLARPFVYDEAWVTVPITSLAEAEQALWLFRLGYDRLRSTPEAILSGRIRERAERPLPRPPA